MKKFEVTLDEVPVERDAALAKINVYGRDGWRLIQVGETFQCGGEWRMRVYFERELANAIGSI